MDFFFGIENRGKILFLKLEKIPKLDLRLLWEFFFLQSSELQEENGIFLGWVRGLRSGLLQPKNPVSLERPMETPPL